VPGVHDGASGLSAAAVDAAHRIATDPGRLAEAWATEVIGELGEAAYVELVGVVTTTVMIDTFSSGLGVPLPPPPLPAHGEPTGETAAEAVHHSAWVRTVRPSAAVGELAAYYRDRATNAFGFVGNVHRALTLVPAEQYRTMALLEAMYLPVRVMGGADPGRALTPTQIELVAATVSLANSCFY
jgi:hypothetical protein